MFFIKYQKPQTRQFNYQPRYYDPQKEELEQKVRKHESSHGSTDGDMVKARMSRHFSDYRLSGRTTKAPWAGSNSRMVMIMVGLFLATYYILSRYSGVILRFLYPVSTDGDQMDMY